MPMFDTHYASYRSKPSISIVPTVETLRTGRKFAQTRQNARERHQERQVKSSPSMIEVQMKVHPKGRDFIQDRWNDAALPEPETVTAGMAAI